MGVQMWVQTGSTRGPDGGSKRGSTFCTNPLSLRSTDWKSTLKLSWYGVSPWEAESSFQSVGAVSANEQSPNVAELLIVGRWRKSSLSDLKL